jgi:signal transduction histidine kinase
LVIWNLLEIAIKYSVPTGRPVEISVLQTAVVVRGTDYGLGIAYGDV